MIQITDKIMTTNDKIVDIFSTFQTVVHLSEDLKHNHVFVVLGASGDLAKKKIYPTLWWLFRDNLIPDNTYFLGYARSKLDIVEYLTKTAYEYMKVKEEEKKLFEEFVKKNYYLAGSYDKDESFKELNKKILDISKDHTPANETNFECNRIFYFALPPTVYTSVCLFLSNYCKAKKYIFFNYFS